MEAMMVHAGQMLATSVLEMVREKAVSLAQEELALLWGVSTEIGKLERELRVIQSVLTDAEGKEVSNESVRIWLERLKDVAYDADDVLDEIATEAAAVRRKNSLEEGTVGCLAQYWVRLQVSEFFLSCFTCTSPNPILFCCGIACKIKGIRVTLEAIVEEQKTLDQIASVGRGRLESTSQGPSRPGTRKPTSESPDDHVFGIERERDEIINWLKSDDGTKVSLVPIVGMGGIGKTTLAQTVFNDPRVTEHFSFRSWVWVGEHFDVEMITKQILNQTLHNSSRQDLKTRLIEKIKNDRFLIVLDDVWSESETTEWERLWLRLNKGDKGGKVVVTTRSHKVANVMGPVTSYSLKGLSDEHCRSILEKFAFGGRSSYIYPNVRKNVSDILKKLEGNPLAAKSVGRFLSHTIEKNTWRSTVVLESNTWKHVYSQTIMPNLMSSYKHLPSHLKHCFVFCSIFPENWKFNRAEIVKMWIAQGFIPPQGHRHRIEDTGFDYFNDLLKLSFFQNVDGNDEYMLHSLMHNLAEAISMEECLRMRDGMSIRNPKKIRHLSLMENLGHSEQQNLLKFEKVRTLCTFGGVSSFNIAQHDLFCQLKCLRVLDLSYCDIADLSDSIGKLKRLRYLDLSNTKIKRLPESLFSLYNLQTLKLKNVSLDELPKGMGNLINLRYLEAEVYFLSRMEGIEKLVSLQELKEFQVVEDSGCSIEVLKDLNEIRGELHILNLENVKSEEEAEGAMLKKKDYLDKLELEWNEYSAGNDTLDMQVLDALQPPPNLKNLIISGNRGVRFPRWMEGQTLSRLESVCLFNCCQIQSLPELQSLSSLNWFRIQSFPQISSLPELEGLDSLNVLEIIDCPQIQYLPVGSLPASLQKLVIHGCPVLEERYKDGGPDWHKISHIPSKTIG